MANFRCKPSSGKLVLLLHFICFTLCGKFVDSLNSNKLVLHWNDPSQTSSLEAGVLSFTSVPSSVSLHSAAENINIQDVPQVISLALGFSSLQNIDWKGLSVGNIFDRPQANVLFIIDGISKGNTPSFSAPSPSYTIVKNEAKSNLDIFRLSPSRNFVDHISNVLKNKPMVVSFSAEGKMAEAASATGGNFHTVTWKSEEQMFGDQTGSDEWKLPKSELLKMFEAGDFGKDVIYDKDNQKFVVSMPGVESVEYDMNKMVNFLFFAELQAVSHIYEKVKKFGALVNDDILDLYTFGISSFKDLSRHYGNGSLQATTAIYVLNHVVSRISKLFNQLYNGQALIEVVHFENKESDVHKKFPSEVNDIYDHLQGHLRSPSREIFNEDLPDVKLREDMESHAMSEICQSLRNKLLSMHSQIAVSCANLNDEGHLRIRRDVTASSKSPPCTRNVNNLAAIDDFYDDEFPPIFNIVLWLMIILVLAVYAVSIVMWFMDPGRDSIIYRVTSQRIKYE